MTRYRSKDFEVVFGGESELRSEVRELEDPEALNAAREQRQADVKQDPLRAALKDFDPIDLGDEETPN